MDRKVWDRVVSGAGALMAFLLVAVGVAAIYGGMFGQGNVRDRLQPQNISFAPADAMTPEESAEVGDFAGQKVENGAQAEAFSRYIGLHLQEVNGGKTYSETSSEARALEEDDPARAELDGMVETLFRGETLRSILLNAYGWWTISTLVLFVGYGMIVVGLILGALAFLGFRHARKVALVATPATGTRAAA